MSDANGATSPHAARLPIVVAVTGASGAPYAVRLLQALVAARRTVWLVVSSHGWRLLDTESGIADLTALRAHVGAAAWDAHVRVFDDGDRGATPASGLLPVQMPERAATATGWRGSWASGSLISAATGCPPPTCSRTMRVASAGVTAP